VLNRCEGDLEPDAELRAGGPVHRAIGIREKPDGPPRSPRLRTEGKHGRSSATVRSPGASLPAGADEDHIQATYDKGVLEVVVSMKEADAQQAQKRIPIMLNKHIKAT
jgi:Hsp20/alpha crystallin family